MAATRKTAKAPAKTKKKSAAKAKKAKTAAAPKAAKRSAAKAKKTPATKDYGRRADYGAPVDGFVAKLPADRRAIVEELRAIVRRAVPGVVESIKWGMPVFEKDGRLLCYASAKRAYVRFGFYEKADFDDPDGELSGSMPAVKIDAASAIDKKRLTGWLKTALAARS